MLLRYLKEQPDVLQKLRAEQRQVGIWPWPFAAMLLL